jgi:hypothetical protein
MSRLPLWISAGLLAAVGLALMIYKVVAIGYPLLPAAESHVWTVQARFTVDSYTRPVKAVLQLPSKPPGYAILDENFVSRGFGLAIVEEGIWREAQWAIREAAGRQTFYYRAVVTPDASIQDADEPGPVTVDSPGEPFATAVETIVGQAQAQSADVVSFTTEVLRRINDSDPDENMELLLSRGGSPGRKAEIAIQLLAEGVVSSRVAYGLELRDGERRAMFQPYLEVWDGASWHWYSPVTADRVRPENLFIWWRGGRPLIDVVGASNPEVEISTWRNVLQALEVAERRADLMNSPVVDYSLLRLPIQVQAVYKVMLLVPIGAFLIVILRNVIGVKTFGTFLPVLVALSFRETRLVAGIVLFVLVVGVGVGLRFLLDRLRLLLVPRLAAVLILVVLALLTISILSHRLGLEVGLSVALFPLVILTIAIERMSIVWEEVGPSEAIQQGLGTLLVAAIAYQVMSLDAIEYLVVVFPEVLLILLAFILLLGRYTGYRLLELVRYKDLMETHD